MKLFWQWWALQYRLSKNSTASYCCTYVKLLANLHTYIITKEQVLTLEIFIHSAIHTLN